MSDQAAAVLFLVMCYFGAGMLLAPKYKDFPEVAKFCYAAVFFWMWPFAATWDGWVQVAKTTGAIFLATLDFLSVVAMFVAPFWLACMGQTTEERIVNFFAGLVGVGVGRSVYKAFCKNERE